MSERKNDPAAAPIDRTLVLTRLFDAPRSLVYAAWTKKEHLDKWCAPRGFTIPASEADFRVGGKWHTLMIAPNGEKYPSAASIGRLCPTNSWS